LVKNGNLLREEGSRQTLAHAGGSNIPEKKSGFYVNERWGEERPLSEYLGRKGENVEEKRRERPKEGGL